MDAGRFSCRYNSCDLFTHAPADRLLYNLGPRAIDGPPDACTLKQFAVTRWNALSRVKVQKVTAKAAAKGKGAKGKGKAPAKASGSARGKR